MTNTEQIYDIIFVGNYTKDTIITPDGTSYVDGGGMNYSASVANQLGMRAAVVTRLAKEDHHVVEIIRNRGIDCFPVYSPYSTLMTLEYKTSNVDQRNLYVKAMGGTIMPEHLDNLTARAVVVSPSIRGEVMPEFFDVIRQRKNILLSADVQGFVRVLNGESLVYAPWPEMQSVLRNLDILKSDAVEAEYLTGETDIEKAASAFQMMGAKEIVLTHSEGVLIHAEGKFFHYTFHSKSMAGRSGRGDTAIGSYVSKRLSMSAKEAGKWSAAATSLKVETPGVFNRSVAEVEKFIAQHYDS